jgi:hypothetical protein
LRGSIVEKQRVVPILTFDRYGTPLFQRLHDLGQRRDSGSGGQRGVQTLTKDPAKMTPKELKAAIQAEADARTTPTLHFMTARAYHASARSLMTNPLRQIAHADVPIRSLFHHAAELYLKAFLLHAGMTAAQLRTREGHDYERLVEEAQKRGLGLAPEFVDTLRALQDLGAFGRARYPSVGSEKLVTPKRLNDLCNTLAPLVGLPVFGTIPPARAHIIEPL